MRIFGNGELLEMEPCIRTITHCSGERYRISFPYLIFIPVVGYERLIFLFCRKSPLDAQEWQTEEIFDFTFPNRSKNGMTCMPHVGNKFAVMRQLEGATAVIQQMVSLFWNSEFTYSLEANKTAFNVTEGARILEHWEKKTKENIDYWKDLYFQEAKKVQSFLTKR